MTRLLYTMKALEIIWFSDVFRGGIERDQWHEMGSQSPYNLYVYEYMNINACDNGTVQFTLFLVSQD